MEAGHEVHFLNRSLARGSSDQLVCTIADINNAILVALDGDMKRIAQGHGVGSGRYLRLGLIKLSCFEPDAPARVRAAMSLIEHEWLVTAASGNVRTAPCAALADDHDRHRNQPYPGCIPVR
jgi:hypothetical protein